MSRSLRIPGTAAQLALFVLVAALAACEGSDARTEQIQPGASRDSALAILGSSLGKDSAGSAAPASADSLKNVWRKTQYLVNGKTIEVLWYSANGERWKASDTVPKGRVIPVVLVDGKVVGVGRTTYDQVATQYGLPKNKY